MNPIAVTVSGINLNNVQGGVAIRSMDVWNTPTREVISNPIALRDGAINTFSRLTPKIITINGWINRSSKQEFERTIDQIKRNMYGRENTLTVTFEDGDRNWTATLLESIFDRDHQPDHADFSLRFWCGNPVAKGAEVVCPTDTLTSTQTMNSATTTFYTNNFQGTSTASILPEIILDVTSFSQVEDYDDVNTYLRISNPDGVGQLHLNFSPNREKYIPDVLGRYEINYETRRITVAGEEVPVSGVWDEWSPSLATCTLLVESNPEAVFSINFSGLFNHRYV